MKKDRAYTVTQVNRYLQQMFEQDYLLHRLLVRGEISNIKYHTSGHVYFTLKDESGTLSAVMFRSAAEHLSFRMNTGDHVVCLGQISIYEINGTYQLYVKEVEPDGEGDLYRRFQENKEKLEEMGYFAEEYKQKIPAFAKKIGIVTAQTGAAIQDIRNIAYRRNPGVQLFLYPAIVQGEAAAPSIVKGIETLDALGMDVLIVGRGGGSMEDLWAFNEVEVVKAVFNCRTPVISAVGHETDTVLTDYAADLRAPTPSAAAELAVFDAGRLVADLSEYKKRMEHQLQFRLELLRKRVLSAEKALLSKSPEARLRKKQMELSEQRNRLDNAFLLRYRRKREELKILAERLHGKSPLLRLAEGYAFLSRDSGKQIRSVSEVKKDDLIRAAVRDGTIFARVEKTEEKRDE